MRFRYLFAALAGCVVAGPAVAEEGTFDSNGVKIHYAREGKGEAIVLIHGWMGDATMWGKDASGNAKPEPPEGFQVIAMDCRGHGKSDKPHEQSKYGAEMAADVVRLMDHLKIEKAHLIGYSMGSFIVGKVAATHPERVISAVYGGQAPIIVGDKPSSPETSNSEVDIFAKLVDEGKDLGAYLIAVTPAGRQKPTEQQASAVAKYLYGGKDVKAFAAAGRSLPNLAVTPEAWKRCKAPTLFIRGGNESEYVKERVANAYKLLGRGELKIVEGTDHIGTLAKPEFASSLLKFIEANKTKQ